jgi:thiol-disulfide isomerase/thioredoxin
MRTLALLLTALAAPMTATGPTPRPAPELVFKNARRGPDLALSQFRGKIVALALTHTTCDHCQFLTQTLNKIQKDYAARNVIVVECAFNENVVMTLGPFMKDVAPIFPMGYTTDAAIKKFLAWNDKRDGTLYIPYMLFIDAKGVIQYDKNGRDGFFVDSDKNVRAILDKMTTPVATKSPAKTAAKKQ